MGAVACALSGEKSRWSWAISLVPTFGKTTRKTPSWLSPVLQWSVAFQLPSGYDTQSHGKSLINGGFNGKIIYFHVPFSMAMLNNQRVQVKPIGFCDLVVEKLLACFTTICLIWDFVKILIRLNEIMLETCRNNHWWLHQLTSGTLT